MYVVKCGNNVLYSPKEAGKELIEASFEVKVNETGSAKFTIPYTNPGVNWIIKKRTIVEIQEQSKSGVLDFIWFRGIANDDGLNLETCRDIELDGVGVFFNGTIVEPFKFPQDFAERDDYIDAAESGNVVEYFLNWLITNHNSQVESWQKLYLGNVTVTDPNNYISRSSENYNTTMEVLKNALYGSKLGGYLSYRYSSDGKTYVDYLKSFQNVNSQKMEFASNIIDIKTESSGDNTYSVILPLGSSVEEQNEEDSETQTISRRVTIESLSDGTLDTNIVKRGKYIIDQNAVSNIGWICKVVTWDDVTVAKNLQTKALNELRGNGVYFQDSVEVKAIDLHWTDEQISSIRPYRLQPVKSGAHGIDENFPMEQIKINMLNLQGSTFTVGKTRKSLTDQLVNRNEFERVEINIDGVYDEIRDVEGNIQDDLENIRWEISEQSTKVLQSAEDIIMNALTEYVATGDYDEFKRTVESQFKIMSDKISMDFTDVTERVDKLTGEIEETGKYLEKHFQFTIDGMIIKAGEGSMELVVDNDMIKFQKDGVVFGTWDGVDFHTGNIVIDVNERAQFGNFAFIPRSDGSLAFLKVGD